ncbi:unnamed protein product [Sphagnum tenellum]
MKFGITHGQAGIYLFTLSTTDNEDEAERSLMKVLTGEDCENKAQPLIPAYVGYSSNLPNRFRQHDVAEKFMKYNEIKWKRRYQLYLTLVPLDQPTAAATEAMLLKNFDFIFNTEHNGSYRVIYPDVCLKKVKEEEEEGERKKAKRRRVEKEIDEVEEYFQNPREFQRPRDQQSVFYAGAISALSVSVATADVEIQNMRKAYGYDCQ